MQRQSGNGGGGESPPGGLRPLLAEVVPETDANPLNFSQKSDVWRVGQVKSLIWQSLPYVNVRVPS